jgi:hypothetical protein
MVHQRCSFTQPPRKSIYAMIETVTALILGRPGHGAPVYYDAPDLGRAPGAGSEGHGKSRRDKPLCEGNLPPVAVASGCREQERPRLANRARPVYIQGKRYLIAQSSGQGCERHGASRAIREFVAMYVVERSLCR